MSALNFHPKLTLLKAASLAAEHGCYLQVQWNGKKPVVTAIPIPTDEYIPFFLRLQAS